MYRVLNNINILNTHVWNYLMQRIERRNIDISPRDSKYAVSINSDCAKHFCAWTCAAYLIIIFYSSMT